MLIEQLPIGSFFKRKQGAKKVYVRQAYNRFAKKYECNWFDDINDYIYLKKGTEVFTDFEF